MDLKKYRKISVVMSFMFIFSILFPRSIKVQAAVQGGNGNVTVVQLKGTQSNIRYKNPLVDVSIEKPLVIGNKIKISINAMNLSNKAQDVRLITGLYDKNNKLVVYELADDNIGYGKNTRLSTEVNVPDSEIYKLKVFVWDSLQEMNPLIDAVEYTVNGEVIDPVNDIMEPTFHSISVSKNDVDLYDKVSVEVIATDDSDLADEANLCYVSEVNGKLVKKEVTLRLENGKYVADLSIDETYGTGNWKVSSITLQDKSNNVLVIYNSKVHEGVGIDLSSADINLKSDILGPIFQGISVSTSTVNLYDKVSIEVNATANSELSEEANLCYVSEVNGKLVEKEVTLKLENGKYVGELLIDETYGIGNWKVSFITLQDKADKVSVIYNSKVHKGLGIDLSAADISLNDDIMAPVFQGISISDNSISLYDTLVVEVQATDNSELAEEANLCYVSEVNGEAVEKEVTLKLENGKYIGKISIDETYKIGKWEVSFITLQDKQENVTVIYNSNVHNGIGIDLSAGDINLASDISGPMFEGISVSGNAINLNDNVIVEVKATDDSELADEANLCYVSEVNGKAIEKEVTLKLQDGRYIGNLLIDETYGVGNWKVSFITRQDKADNVTVIYNSDVHTGLGVDLSVANLNLSGDIVPPIFESVSVNQNTVSLYDNVIVEVKATDNSNLASEANLCYVSEVNGKTVEKEITLKLENGKYVGNLSIDETYGVGNWKVSFITLQDTFKNVRIIYNSKIHAGLGVDLSAADINLSADIAGPTFEGILLNAKTINLYDTLIIEVKATDNSELAEEANLCYVSEVNGEVVEKEVTLKLENGKYVGKVSIDETYKNGNWKVSFITLQDKASNVTVVYNSKVHAGLGVDLSAGDINLSDDISAPNFEEISVVSDEIEDYFTIRVKASDDMAGLAEEANISYVHQYLSGPAEQEIKLTLEDGVYVGKIRSAEATWDVNFITLEDKANNVRVIYNSKVHNGLGQDLSNGKIFIEDDIVAPWLRGISVNTSNVNLYDNVVIRVEAFENISKLAKEANVYLVSDQDGKTVEKEISLNLINEIPGNEAGIGTMGTYEAQLNIDKDFGIGKWRVSFITLQDANNNVKIYYNANVHEGLGMDLSASDFNTNIDGLDLNLNSIKVTKTSAKLGDRVYIVMDASSNVEIKETASLCYILKTSNGAIEKEITLDLVDGKYVGSIDIDQSLASGLLQISFITVEDVDGNVIVVYNSNVHSAMGTDLSIGNVEITK